MSARAGAAGPTLTSTDLPRGARAAYAANAVVAWLGVVLTLLISALDGYDRTRVDPGLYGDTARGLEGAPARLLDSLSYFTIWSNIVVAISVTLLLASPLPRTTARAVLRMAGLLMITVTGIVYQLLLAPTAVVTGWSVLTNPILHVVTPILTVLVWLVWGPRGWTSWRIVGLAMLLPLAWIVWMLARGAVIGAYPYGFVNVGDLGWASVLATLGQIVVFGIIVGALLHGIDRLLVRLRRR